MLAAQRRLLYLFIAAVAGVAFVVTQPVLAVGVDLPFVRAVSGARGDEVHDTRVIAHAGAALVVTGYRLSDSVAASVAVAVGCTFGDSLIDRSFVAGAAIATIVTPPRFTMTQESSAGFCHPGFRLVCNDPIAVASGEMFTARTSVGGSRNMSHRTGPSPIVRLGWVDVNTYRQC